MLISIVVVAFKIYLFRKSFLFFFFTKDTKMSPLIYKG